MELSVGQIVIMKNADYYMDTNGCPGVIEGRLCMRSSTDLRTMQRVSRLTYRVRILNPENLVVNARPDQVRPLRDPEELRSGEAQREREYVIVR